MMVYNGRVYIYMSSDSFEYDSIGNIIDNDYKNIKLIICILFDDMVNWIDYGEILVVGLNGLVKWVSNFWVLVVIYKVINGKEKFFMYFVNNGGVIGVFIVDILIGLWKDFFGKFMIIINIFGVNGVEWFFDLVVLIDDDGIGYLYFGGGILGGKNFI